MTEPHNGLSAPADGGRRSNEETGNPSTTQFSGSGIDVPGVGIVRDSVLRGREGEPGEVPATLRDHIQADDRNRLLIELIFAARRLTDGMLLPYGNSSRQVFCKHCGRHAAHAPGCDVGTIVRALDALEQLEAAQPKGGAADPREWVIQRCTQKWIGNHLQYEDYPTAQGVMTRTEAFSALERIDRSDPINEYRAHRVRPEGGAR